MFCECKWQNGCNAKNVLLNLKQKARSVNWHSDRREEYFVIFAKSFKERIKEKNVFLFDLNDIKKVVSTV